MLARIRRNIDFVTATLGKTSPTHDTLSSGNINRCLYYLLLYKCFGQVEYYNKGLDVYEGVLDRITSGSTTLFRQLSLTNGLAGFGWLTHLMLQKDILPGQMQDSLIGIDERIFRTAIGQIRESNMDYMHSAVGALHYLVQRLEQNPRATGYVTQSVHEILRQRKQAGNRPGAYLHNQFVHRKLKELRPEDVDLGLAHGLCGILLVLLEIHRRGILRAEIEEALTEGLEFILSTAEERHFADLSRSFFPGKIRYDRSNDHDENQAFYGQGLGWCYGDLDQVLLLFRAGTQLKCDKWLGLADRVGDFTLRKREDPHTHVQDVFLCHGTTGVYRFYQAIYRVTNDRKYLDAAHHWLQESLERLEKQTRTGDSPEEINGLWSGLVGVGLALLSSLSPEKEEWETMLLL